MAKVDVIQSHMELLMQRYLETDELKVEPSGAIAVSNRSALYRVRTLPGANPHVNVYAVAIEDIEADPGLYEALNDYNARMSHARVFWVDRKVIIDAELVGEGLDEVELACTISEVAGWSHDEGPKLAKTFGGTVADPDRIEDEEEEEEA